MIAFRAPTRETLLPFLKMELTEAQWDARLVAPNAVTLAQAAYNPASEVWGIYDGDTPVGLMALIDFAHPEADLQEGDPPDALYLWRLLIDETHQRKGYGRAALDHAVKRARALQRSSVTLGAVPGDQSAIPFYESYGFVQTGRVVDGEREMAFRLT